MVNWVKKVTKSRSSDLHPGEEVEAAVLVQPAGTMNRMIGGQLGGIVGAVVADRGAAKRAEETAETADHGMADDFPDKAAVLALTPTRFLVFGHATVSGKVTDLVAEYRRSDVTIDAEKNKLQWRFVITLPDGSTVDVDAPRPGKPEAFVKALADS